jgi:diguanylate cyclase (GGDEF)-like protein
LAVVESSTFASIEECRRFVIQQRCPVLCIVSAEQVADLVGWLQVKDDICLDTAPETLIAARLGKLRMAQFANIDPLTGLQRREALFSSLRSWSGTARPETELTMILADLDHFKVFSDEQGREPADHCLQRMGALLRRLAPHALVVARTGGQEFALLLEHDDQAAAKVAESIRQRVEEGELDEERPLTLSLGVGTLGDAGCPQELYRVSDEALYAAKAQGRNRVVTYGELRAEALASGEDLDLTSLEYKSRVLGERVAQTLRQFEFPVRGWSRGEKRVAGVETFAGADRFDAFLAGVTIGCGLSGGATRCNNSPANKGERRG